jgi:GNAT superfamily N-acetyltransferase
VLAPPLRGDRESVVSVRITPAQSAADYRAFGALISDYVAWCRERYAHDAWFVEEVFGHQDLEHERQRLPATYGPPAGLTLLARQDGELCGGGAWRRLEDDGCELKRMFVSDRCKGQGIGRALGAALIESARPAALPGVHGVAADTAGLSQRPAQSNSGFTGRSMSPRTTCTTGMPV